MIQFTILYPKTDSSQFDFDYYFSIHLPLVRERLTPYGLKGIDLQEGLSGSSPSSPPPYVLITGLNFQTIDGLTRGLQAHGPELQSDISNFTNVEPLTQLSNRLVASLVANE